MRMLIVEDGHHPIRLLVHVGHSYRTVTLSCAGGLRYPHRGRTNPTTPASLDAVAAPRR